jgi:hypothetical protein
MRNPFVFLVGCPRSGTTLLRRLVNAHPQIAIVPEIRWLSQRFVLREGLTPDGLLTPAFFGMLRDFGRFSRVPIDANDLAAFARKENVPYADFISALFDGWGRKRGKELVGHKNADHAVPTDVATLHALWPHAKFIHLIRDGRDVCLSVLNWRVREKVGGMFSTWRGAPISTISAWWEWQVRLVREQGARLWPDRYREVRYERLVREPEDVCRELCEFVGLPFEDAMLRFHESPPPDRTPKQAWLPPTPGRRDWRSQMSAEDQERFEAVAGELLDELGYERRARTIGPASIQEAAAIRAEFELTPLPERWAADAARAPASPPGTAQ